MNTRLLLPLTFLAFSLLLGCEEERPALCPSLQSFGSEVMRPTSFPEVSSMNSVLTTPTGYIGLGHMDDERMSLCMLDEDGNLQSSRIIEDQTVEPTFLLPMSNTGYLAVGRTRQIGDPDMYLAAINELGGTIWSRQYSLPGINNTISAAETDEGNFLVLSDSSVDGSETLTLRNRVEVFIVDGDGELEQARLFNLGPASRTYALVRPQQTTEKYWAFVGVTNPPSTLNNMALLELSAEGDSLGVRTFGELLDGGVWTPHAAQATNDGGAVITMQTGANNTTDTPAGLVVIKLDPDGEVEWEQK